jgi:hypothetical protein
MSINRIEYARDVTCIEARHYKRRQAVIKIEQHIRREGPQPSQDLFDIGDARRNAELKIRSVPTRDNVVPQRTKFVSEPCLVEREYLHTFGFESSIHTYQAVAAQHAMRGLFKVLG